MFHKLYWLRPYPILPNDCLKLPVFISVLSDEKMCSYISTLDINKHVPFKSRKFLKQVEQSI